MRSSFAKAVLILALLAVVPALAQSFARPSALDEVIGGVVTVSASREETLLDIARRFGVGQQEILLANPSVDRWLPADGAEVTIPTAYILPRTERRGLVLNVPEMRLYYYPPRIPGQPDVVHTFPVSIGRMDWSTPIGTTRIVEKTENPRWRPPDSIIAEHASNGDKLPEVVPPGPDNPLGRFAFRLGIPGYLIHSTNKPYGVGMRVTHGCIRMYPENIEFLYPLVPVGTPVRIINQPIKVGWLGDQLYVEIHPPLEEETPGRSLRKRVLEEVQAESSRRRVVLDEGALKTALKLQNGIPMPIGRTGTAGTAANP
ncbi:MAG TPA: L,D-transpeptidase family protein [Polyangiales bacterium]|nr:L,D-transpeptidase family protein [Polyangiales bacterium]